jgi:hypothetical protein
MDDSDSQSQAVRQAFSRIQSLFRDYQELNEEKLDSYEGEIGDFVQRRAYEKKFKAKGNIAHSNLSFQRATDETTTNQQKDDLLAVLSSLILEESQLTAIEFDSDIFGRGKKRRQYFFQPGTMNSASMEDTSVSGKTEKLTDGQKEKQSGKKEERQRNEEENQPGSPMSSPISPSKTRATTAGTDQGDLSAEEEEDFEAEMQRNKFVFESLVDKARGDNDVRKDKLLECFQRLKNKQKEMIFRLLDDFKKAHSYQRMKNRLLELDSSMVKNKALLSEKKYALQVKKAQSNISAEELRKRFEYETEQQVRHLLEQGEKRKHEVEELTRKHHGIEEETERLLKELSLVLYDLEKEEKALPPITTTNSPNSKGKGGNGNRPNSPSHQITGLSSTTQYDDLTGIFEVFPFIQNSGGELTDEMIDQALKVVEESELKLNTMRGMITLAEEDYVKKKTNLNNLIKGEDNKANERLKKLCVGLEQKIASDEKRVELLENLIKGLKKEKQPGSSTGGGSSSSGGNVGGTQGTTRVRHRSSAMLGPGGETTTAPNKRQTMVVARPVAGSNGSSKETSSSHHTDGTHKSHGHDESSSTKSQGANNGSITTNTTTNGGTTGSNVPPPQTSFHNLLKQYLENSFLVDLTTTNNQKDANQEGSVNSDPTVVTPTTPNGTSATFTLTDDKMEEIINQYRIIAPHQVMKMSKSIEVFQDFASSKLHHINAIIPPSQHLTTMMNSAMATVHNGGKKGKLKLPGVSPTNNHSSLSSAMTFTLPPLEEAGNKIENIPGTRPADYKAPRQEELVEAVYFESFAYNIAVEQLNSIITMLLQWNTSGGSVSNGKAELGMRTEEEELENIEDLRHEINKILELLKGTYRDGQQVQRVYKDLSHDFNEQLRVCDRLRAELLREVEGLQWSSMLQPGQYQVEIEICKNRIGILKQQLKGMEERVSSRRKTNIRLSQLLTDKKIYPTDITTSKHW